MNDDDKCCHVSVAQNLHLPTVVSLLLICIFLFLAVCIRIKSRYQGPKLKVQFIDRQHTPRRLGSTSGRLGRRFLLLFRGLAILLVLVPFSRLLRVFVRATVLTRLLRACVRCDGKATDNVIENSWCALFFARCASSYLRKHKFGPSRRWPEIILGVPQAAEHIRRTIWIQAACPRRHATGQEAQCGPHKHVRLGLASDGRWYGALR